jgi:hypothetical protein
MMPKRSTVQVVALLRRRYPDSLVCDSCARLLASTGYADYAGPFHCASCATEAPALAREAAKRFEALSRRGPAPKPEDMHVLAAGDGAHRLESLALMGVVCSRCAGKHSMADCGYDDIEAAAAWRARGGTAGASILAPIQPREFAGLQGGFRNARRRAGRPRKHPSPAKRQAAYRARRQEPAVA